MADRYWVGGTALWDSTAGTKWSTTSGGAGGASVPTSADAVFFNAASGAVTVTVSTGGGTALSINCTGFTGTLTGTVALNVSGSVTFVSGMTLGASLDLNLLATGTLTTGGKTLSDVNISATGGTVTLGSALSLGTSKELTLTAGTLSTSASNFAITANELILSGTGTKTLTLNASTVTLTGAATPFNYSGSNLTFNAGTSTITFNTSSGCTLNAGTGLTFNNVSFTGTGAGILRTIRGSNTFNQLSFTAPASAGYSVIEFDGNQTITTLIANGASVVRRFSMRSSAFGTARILTVGTYATKTNIDFRDITAAGASSPWAGTSIGNCLGNSNITFTAAKTVYWNLTGAQNWTATAWATASGGAVALGNFPLPQDTAIFDNAGAATDVTTQSYTNIGTINSSARTSVMTLTAGSGTEFFGNFTNGTGVTLSIGNNVYFSARGVQTITSAGATFAEVNTYSPNIVLTLGDALICTGEIRLTSTASFNASSYTVTAGTLSAATGTVNLGTASWTITGSSNCWSTTNSIITGTAEIILSNNTTSPRNFLGGSNTYGKLTIGGNTSTSVTSIFNTNTFAEIASTKTVAHTIVFPNVTTTVGAFTVRGSAGNVVTLARTGASGTFTLAKSGGGVVDTDYLSISNSTASPINTWYAGANSTNGGGNSNWIFTAGPFTAAGNFFSLF
jgi:hypothetical protein